ncbi:MAG: LacI family transcriptional regulator [Candidatus Marinimicrobia bacterium]|nr:LacI family transcriptional regulator [Candidatus Neomarinimicrobiota bacterium]
MAVTLTDISEIAGVSVSTVSRVLNGKSEKHRISADTQQKVIAAAERLNYRPNELARGLRLQKTHTIGLIVPDISNPFFANISRSIQVQAYENGYSTLVANTDENIETEIEQIKLLRSKGVDGFVIMPVGLESAHIKELLSENTPLVLLDRCFDDLNTNSVVVNNFKGAYMATEHLIKNGHSRISIIQGLRNTSTNNSRVAGYKQALNDYGIPISTSLIVGKSFGQKSGYLETKLLLNLDDPPSAIFATSDLITLGVFHAVYEEGLSIPDHISIVSFDDVDFGAFLAAPLTAIAQPKDLMGEMAVKLLLEDIDQNGAAKKSRIVLKPELIQRNSVRYIKEIKTIEKPAG